MSWRVADRQATRHVSGSILEQAHEPARKRANAVYAAGSRELRNGHQGRVCLLLVSKTDRQVIAPRAPHAGPFVEVPVYDLAAHVALFAKILAKLRSVSHGQASRALRFRFFASLLWVRSAFVKRRDDDGSDEGSGSVEIGIASGQDVNRGKIVFAEQIGQPTKTPAQDHHVSG